MRLSWPWRRQTPKVSSVSGTAFLAKLSLIVSENSADISSVVLSYVGNDELIVDWRLGLTQQKTKHFRVKDACPHCTMLRALCRVAGLVLWSTVRQDELAALYESQLKLGIQTNVHFIRPDALGQPEQDVQMMLAEGWHYHRMVSDAHLDTRLVCDGHRSR